MTKLNVDTLDKKINRLNLVDKIFVVSVTQKGNNLFSFYTNQYTLRLILPPHETPPNNPLTSTVTVISKRLRISETLPMFRTDNRSIYK